jgi:ribosomal protein S3
MREHNKYKSLFLTYFDGCYGVDAEPDTPSTYQMGVCKLEQAEETNVLTVHLRRPGLLIGKGGSLINKLKEHLECEIHIVEVIL